MTARWLLLVMLSWSWADGVLAKSLYRCVAADGARSYVSRPIANAQCTVLARYPRRSRSMTDGIASSTVQSDPPQPSRESSHRPVTGPVVAGALSTAGQQITDSGLGCWRPLLLIHQRAVPIFPTPAPVSPMAAASPCQVPSAQPMPARSSVAMTKAPAVDRLAANPRQSTGFLYTYLVDGVRHYTSAAPVAMASVVGLRTIHYVRVPTCFACGVAKRVDFYTVDLHSRAYAREIAQAAQLVGIEEPLLRAVIHAESAFNPLAFSRAGAQGLMQLMPATAQRFGVRNAFDVAENIRGGAQYLAWLLHYYHGNQTLAFAGYNAGEHAVDRYRRVPPYAETQRYVRRVKILLDRYRQAQLRHQVGESGNCTGGGAMTPMLRPAAPPTGVGPARLGRRASG